MHFGMDQEYETKEDREKKPNPDQMQINAFRGLAAQAAAIAAKKRSEGKIGIVTQPLKTPRVVVSSQQPPPALPQLKPVKEIELVEVETKPRSDPEVKSAAVIKPKYSIKTTPPKKVKKPSEKVVKEKVVKEEKPVQIELTEETKKYAPIEERKEVMEKIPVLSEVVKEEEKSSTGTKRFKRKSKQGGSFFKSKNAANQSLPGIPSGLDIGQRKDMLSEKLWQEFWETLFRSDPFSDVFKNAWQSRSAERGIKSSDLVLGEVLCPTLSVCGDNPMQRIEECREILSVIGDSTFQACIQVLENSPDLVELFEKISELEGTDVYWDGLVDNEKLVQLDKINKKHPLPISTLTSMPRVPNSSKTKFGKLSVSPFPFTAEFRYDDVENERLTLSLLSLAVGDSDEKRLVKELMHKLVKVNSSSTDEGKVTTLMKIQRIQIRMLGEQRVHLVFDDENSTVHKITEGDLYVRDTSSSNRSERDEWNDGTISCNMTRGLDVCLKECTIKKRKKYMFGKLWTPWRSIRFDLKSIHDLAEAPENWFLRDKCPEQLRTELDKLKPQDVDERRAIINKLRSKRPNYSRRQNQLPYSFVLSVLDKPQLSLVDLGAYLKANSNSKGIVRISECLFSPRAHPYLIQVRRAIEYLAEGSLAEIYWFLHWYEYSQIPKNESHFPKSVAFDLKAGSFLFQEKQYQTEQELRDLGFPRSKEMKVFFRNLDILRKHSTSESPTIRAVEKRLKAQGEVVEKQFRNKDYSESFGTDQFIKLKNKPISDKENVKQNNEILKKSVKNEIKKPKENVMSSLKDTLFASTSKKSQIEIILAGDIPLPKLVRPEEVRSPILRAYLESVQNENVNTGSAWASQENNEKLIWDNYQMHSWKRDRDGGFGELKNVLNV